LDQVNSIIAGFDYTDKLEKEPKYLSRNDYMRYIGAMDDEELQQYLLWSIWLATENDRRLLPRLKRYGIITIIQEMIRREESDESDE